MTSVSLRWSKLLNWNLFILFTSNKVHGLFPLEANTAYSLSQYALALLNGALANGRLLRELFQAKCKTVPHVSKFNGTGSSVTSSVSHQEPDQLLPLLERRE